MLQIKFMNTYYEIAFRWMPQYTFDVKSKLVQALAWCYQTTSHDHANVGQIYVAIWHH